ncbi:putative reverse transcriptase domain-containing protein [Tanacetum coccineum]
MAEYSQKWHNGTSRGRSTETSDGLAAIQAQLNNLGRDIKKEEGKTLEEAYYTKLMEETLSKFMGELAKRHEENSNLIKEIQAMTDAAIRNQGASIKTLEIQIGQMSKVLQERGFRSLPSLTEANPRDQVKLISTTIEADSHLICRIGSSQYTISTRLNRASASVMPLLTYLNLGLGELAHTRLTVELADRTVKYPKGIAKNVLVEIGKFTFPVDFIILDMSEDIKVPLILRRSFLSTAYAKIDVYKRNITLRVGEERIVFSSVKPTSSLIKRVCMLSLRERMELDLEGRLMGETLVLNRSLDLFLEDYIDLNDLNKPFELRRNQEDVLMTTIEEGEINIDCAHNLKFSCMIGFEFTHFNFFPLLYVNVMSKKFHNSIMKDKMVYKGDNVVGALMNMPIFVGTFSIVTDFAVLEDMDAYRDNGIGDVIVGEPFLREVRIKTKRFEGIITLYKSDDEVTYQMVQSLLKVSEVDMMNGISHAYQKLKGFYKGVLNLGPDYI